LSCLEQPAAPVHLRAIAVKAEFADIENLKSQLAAKDEVVAELRRLLKQKVCYRYGLAIELFLAVHFDA
jgi:hypothetical protein